MFLFTVILALYVFYWITRIQEYNDDDVQRALIEIEKYYLKVKVWGILTKDQKIYLNLIFFEEYVYFGIYHHSIDNCL